MKILRIISSFDPINGGPRQGILNSIKELSKFGIENEVVCLDSPNAAFLEQETFKIHALGKGKSTWAFSSNLIPWLKKNIFEYDVVIVHGLWQFIGFATYQVLKYSKTKQNKPKLFVMPHGMLDPYFQNAKGRELKAIRNYFYWKWIESKLIHLADGLLFTSKTEMELAATTFRPYEPKKAIDIGYGIQPPPKPNSAILNAIFEKLPTLEKKPFLLFLSRIHEKKGLDILLEAYVKLQKTFNHNTVPNLLISGPGWDSTYGIELLNKIKKTGLYNSKIFVTNMLLGDEKWSALYNSKALVLPSHQENFGIVIAEALGCGKPVLTTNKVNIWQDILKSNVGFIENDDFIGIFNLLEKFIHLSPKEYDIMHQGSIKMFHDQYSSETTITKLIAAIK